jgi:hypothetical protein
MSKTLGKFVGAQYGRGAGGGGVGGAGPGGGPGTGTNARRTAQRVGRNLGNFFSSVGSSGATIAAEQIGIDNLQGMSANDIVLSLTNKLGGPATTIDDVDARNALARLMNERLKGLSSAEVIQALEVIPTGSEFIRFIERFFALYIFEQFNRVFYSRLEARAGKDKAAQYLRNGLHCIEWMLRGKTSRIDVGRLNWAGRQGGAIIDSIMDDVFQIFAGGVP